MPSIFSRTIYFSFLYQFLIFPHFPMPMRLELQLIQGTGSLPTNSEHTKTMPSGYGAYANGTRASNYSLIGTPASGIFSENVTPTYRSPRIPTSSISTTSLAAISAPQESDISVRSCATLF